MALVTASIQRVSPRDQTKITGTVTCKTGSSNGVVKDLSPQGICFQLFFDIGATVGQEVAIQSEQLGRLTGMVRWCRGDRIGIKLNLSSNTAAQISSYYKFFSQPEGWPA
ncbi:MAG TPA: PilZ domain-containing protein [Sinorhizobium sp.]|nr:PilZ domain-containing protein [Sinorhizobium sp.]